MLDLIISGPRIYTECEGSISGSIGAKDGKIVMLQPSMTQEQFSGITSFNDLDLPAKSNQPLYLKFPDSYHVVPGFIDLHIHGANNYDVMDGTFAALTEISKALLAEGTTSFLATTMTSDIAQLEQALEIINQCKKNQLAGAHLLGCHLEGPFISEKKMGAQCRHHILAPSVNLFQKWEKLANDSIKIVTLAPELSGSDVLINYLRAKNILVSIGHSDASYKESLQAIQHGCNYVTHLFNAMRGIHQREPGVVTAGLLEDVYTEIIADGIHLHPAILRLILQVKNFDKIILVTDAMRAKCLGEGKYELGGQQVTVAGNMAKLADGTLAGSVLTMLTAIKNMITFTSCSFSAAIKMATENPARAINIYDRKGSIAIGKDADIVVLDENLNLVLTVCHGRVAYKKTSCVA